MERSPEPHCEGLNGPWGALAFLDGTLADWARGAEGVTMEPGVIAAPRAVAKVAGLGRARRAPARFVPDAVGSEAMAALSGGNPGVLWAGGGGPELRFDAEERAIDLFPMPDGPLRVADAWVFPVRHWVQLLWANLLALGPFLWERLVGRGGEAAARLAWATMRSGSTRPEAMAAALTRRASGARVHRSATVEFSWLGAGAQVGAGAIVRGCVLGEGAVVEELAVVEGAVLGRGARVQRQALAKYVVLDEGAAHAGIAQLSVLGRGAVVKQGATLMDLGLGQGVSVRVGGELRRAPHDMCGVCVGEGTVVASGVRVAPGRAVPAGLTVLADPGTVLTRVDVPPGADRVVVRDGRLEPAP